MNNLVQWLLPQETPFTYGSKRDHIVRIQDLTDHTITVLRVALPLYVLFKVPFWSLYSSYTAR